MTKKISCTDAGFNCGWFATAETEAELMGKATEHVKESHKDIQLTPEFAEKVKSLMKDV
jgi:predicted small metal-binding protein